MSPVSPPRTPRRRCGVRPRATVAVLLLEGTVRVLYLVAPRRRSVLTRLRVPAGEDAGTRASRAGWTVTLGPVRRRTPRWWTDYLPAGTVLAAGVVLEWPRTWGPQRKAKAPVESAP